MGDTGSNPVPDQGASALTADLEPLTVTVHRPHAALVLLRVHGEVDLVTAPGLRRALDDVCSEPARGGARRVVCDLSGVDFLGAAGVDALLGAAEMATGHGWELHLVASTRRVCRVLAVCGVEQQLPVSRDLVDVLDAAANPPGTR
jgi:anti-sigma B factor antagonist